MMLSCPMSNSEPSPSRRPADVSMLSSQTALDFLPRSQGLSQAQAVSDTWEDLSVVDVADFTCRIRNAHNPYHDREDNDLKYHDFRGTCIHMISSELVPWLASANDVWRQRRERGGGGGGGEVGWEV